MPTMTSHGFEDDFTNDQLEEHADIGIRDLEAHLRSVAEMPYPSVQVRDVGRYATGLEPGLYRRRHAALPLSRLAIQKEIPPVVSAELAARLARTVEYDPRQDAGYTLAHIAPDDTVG